MNAVEMSGVTKTFGAITAVNELSLTVPTGSVYGFIGPNGSGKTTTIRMIMRIFYPDRGDIRVFGQAHSTAATDRIGYLPEERGLYKKMKVHDVLSFYARLKGINNPKSDIDSWLAKMGLSDWGGRRVETLSKGMAQKVQFIGAVVSRPELVILDEPFSGLDPVNLDVLRDAILGLKRQGSTVIFSTHDMSAAEKMCDQIFMIYKGRKVLDGTLASIQDQYGSDTIRLRLDDSSCVSSLKGVDRVADFGNYQEVRLTNGTDPQQVLTALASRTRIGLFEVARPSLHDIFVRIAGPEAQAS
ncbi:MAG: ATP-binding cassette domain-containing protein [Phycisphaerales bacterium]|nr:ATP-binding cassette domain-containing protein [Phycisphaerales bacterium]MCB9854560.1 ATP-binding cassette domain-containing protein [Phycisphaerales bacterium]MCB9863215.1 ATP-binding cassette domain-containing protein [Phycisphaerales bacterium]